MEFPSQGAVLRGRLYRGEGGERRLTVIMAHGFSATITGMVADRYAEVFQAAGLTVLLFDHRSFGLSGGEPRQLLNHWVQARGYRDALDHATTLPEVDPDRVALWGDSMSAAVALAVGAFDERVRAVVVQVPACGPELPPADPNATLFESLRETFLHADVELRPKDTVGPMAVVSPDQIKAMPAEIARHLGHVDGGVLVSSRYQDLFPDALAAAQHRLDQLLADNDAGSVRDRSAAKALKAHKQTVRRDGRTWDGSVRFSVNRTDPRHLDG